MEKRIPITTIEFDGAEGKRVLEVYKWLSQDEENDYNLIISEGQDFEKDENGEFRFKVLPSTLAKANKFLFQALVKNVEWDEFNYWPPKDREMALDKLSEITTGEDKKKE